MQMWSRIVYRAGVLTENWLHQNAFTVGMVFGGSVTLLLILVH